LPYFFSFLSVTGNSISNRFREGKGGGGKGGEESDPGLSDGRSGEFCAPFWPRAWVYSSNPNAKKEEKKFFKGRYKDSDRHIHYLVAYMSLPGAMRYMTAVGREGGNGLKPGSLCYSELGNSIVAWKGEKRS